MNRCLRISFLYILIFLSFSSKHSNAEENNFWAVTIKTSLDQWTVSRNLYSRLTCNSCGSGDSKYSDKNTIEKTTSKSEYSVGTEISYTTHNLFLRGSIIQGDADFPNDVKGRRRELEFDVGLGETVGGFIGYRSIDTSFSNLQSQYISGGDYSDGILGLQMRSSPFKKGFSADFDMIFGLTAIAHAFSNNSVENLTIAEGELNFGYRFTDVPININLGCYGWSYEKPVKQESHQITEHVGSDSVETILTEGYGVILKATYLF